MDPRPQKRLRTDHFPDTVEPAASTSSHTLSSFRPLPPPVLLLALPALLAHPPGHEQYPLSLFLSLRALRTCLGLETLTPDVECRAWTGLAEVGLRVINSGLTTSTEHVWAHGIEFEVEKAIGKGLFIAQKHPSLRPLRHHLSLLNAQFAFQSDNTKYARALLRRLIASFMSSDPPSIVYIAHLALIAHLTSTPSSPDQNGSNSPHSAPEIQAALTTISTLSNLAVQNKHSAIQDLATVLNVRVLVGAEHWDLVGDALSAAERAMQLVFVKAEEQPVDRQEREKVRQDTADTLMRSHSITAQDVHSSASSQSQSQPNENPPPSPVKQGSSIPGPKATDPLTLALTAHLLILGVIFHTHSGRARDSDARLAALHALMDSGALVGGANSDGLVEIPLPGYDSIFLQLTHPHILFLLTFLVSAVAKRDPVSRRPKKRVFAECGLVQCRGGRQGKEGEGFARINVPLWASFGDVAAIQQQALRIEADLLCELVTVSTQRSDFEAAQSHLATLIAHARTHDFFQLYSARIVLLHAHLAHALGDTERAGTCYRVAAHLDGAGPVGSGSALGGFTAAAARASEALLRIGLSALQPPLPTASSAEQNHIPLDDATMSLVRDALSRCSSGASAPLPALGELISAALSRPHIIRTKSLLKHALELLSSAADNHLRALVLAVVGAQYVHTAPAHAMEVLAVCETLGAGMGANSKKEQPDGGGGTSEETHHKDGVGNAPLRLWVGERFLELFKRTGKESRVHKQEAFNATYQAAVDDFARHRARLC